MDFHFLGGAMEVGGSCIYMRVGEYGILFDSGIRQGGAKDPLPDFRSLQVLGGVDVILISHAHMDHIGTLPIVSKAYPQAPIYMTHMAQDLVRVLLYDSLKIMERREDEIPHYSEVDVRNMLNRIHPVRYQSPVEIMDGMTLTLYPAGHIAGAACMYLVTEEGSIFYSGDFCSFLQRTIEGARIPKLRPDVAIVESTYGNRLHANRQVEENRLVELVRECVAKEMKILIPAFALGRAQEVLLILRSAIQNQELPKVPVYVDGMVRDINAMYYRNPTYLKNTLAKRILKGNEPFYTEEIRPVETNADREALLQKSGAAVFVSSSGMLTGGPSMLYAKKIASMENGCIIITGYQDEEAPGRALINLMEQTEERKITLDGSTIQVNCRVEQVGLSAHGDKSEIAALMDRITPRQIFLVHGDADAIGELGKEISSDYKRRIFMPKCGDSYDIQLHTKRKQVEFSLPYSMQRDEELAPEREKQFWEYIRLNYVYKPFTLEQMAYIWYGRKVSEDVLQKLQSELMESPYFSMDAHRLFLFVANSEEQVQENLTPRMVTNQELEQLVQEITRDIPYKKVSFFSDKKQVALSYDYPDVQDRKMFEECAKEFLEKTGWELVISGSVNHQAVGTLLRSLFGTRLIKTSYYQERKEYVIQLKDEQEEDPALAKRFLETTGWGLVIKGSGINVAGIQKQIPLSENAKMYFLPEAGMEALEQNQALFSIDQTFSEEKYAPYKKSIKSDSDGKYIELSFLSPEIGKRVSHLIKKLADQTGWRMRIADSTNQNELSNILLDLCGRYGIKLVKNPSYLPGQQMFRLNIEEANRELPEEFQREFYDITGCRVTGSK